MGNKSSKKTRKVENKNNIRCQHCREFTSDIIHHYGVCKKLTTDCNYCKYLIPCKKNCENKARRDLQRELSNEVELLVRCFKNRHPGLQRESFSGYSFEIIDPTSANSFLKIKSHKGKARTFKEFFQANVLNDYHACEFSFVEQEPDLIRVKLLFRNILRRETSRSR
jgi:hypothetical protein